MLDSAAQQYPRVFVLVPNEAGGNWKTRVGESPNGDDSVCIPLPMVVNDGAAMRAEVEGGPAAFLTYADVCRGSAPDMNGVAREAGLSSEGAAGAPLAVQAVADRDTQGSGGDGDG